MSVLQVLIQAGGLSPLAKPSHAMILRPISNTSRRAAIPIDLSLVLKGVGNDKPLLPNDVLVVTGRGGLFNPQNTQLIIPFISITALAIAIASRL
jgi:hypothetical protein